LTPAPKREAIRQPLAGDPVPALLVTQAQFENVAGPDGQTRPVPGYAKLTIVRHMGDAWTPVVVEDPESNVFHKAIAFDVDGDGPAEIVTIGAQKALLKAWRFDGGAWTARTLLARSYGGGFDRFRDLEIGDVDGDGKPEYVIATHDQGVIELARNTGVPFTSTEIDRAPGGFVHEIEIGDVDGDGVSEIFATPSRPNSETMVSQPGEIVMFKWNGKGFAKTVVDTFPGTHAKEVLVTNLDGRKPAVLLASVEARTAQDGAGTVIVDPVEVRAYHFGKDGSIARETVATIADRQCRFLTPGDLNGDGRTEIAAAAMKTGLWLLTPTAKGAWTTSRIDRESSGYEHAALAVDLDGDGKTELYVASDDQGELRRYDWDGKTFAKSVLMPLDRTSITWNLMPGRF
jgi:hypothetical protein